MDRVFQDIQNSLSLFLPWPILKNPVHPVYAVLCLLHNLKWQISLTY
jgi:hypothetical protein